jgi:hypothetical protein
VLLSTVHGLKHPIRTHAHCVSAGRPEKKVEKMERKPLQGARCCRPPPNASLLHSPTSLPAPPTPGALCSSLPGPPPGRYCRCPPPGALAPLLLAGAPSRGKRSAPPHRCPTPGALAPLVIAGAPLPGRSLRSSLPVPPSRGARSAPPCRCPPPGALAPLLLAGAPLRCAPTTPVTPLSPLFLSHPSLAPVPRCHTFFFQKGASATRVGVHTLHSTMGRRKLR